MKSITKGRSTSGTSGRDKAKGRVGLAVVTLIAVGLVLMAVLAACGSGADEPTKVPPAEPAIPEQAPAQDGATLLEARCSTCHSADRAKQVNKTRDGWDQTVTSMINRGAQLTEAETVVLVDYLTETYGP